MTELVPALYLALVGLGAAAAVAGLGALLRPASTLLARAAWGLAGAAFAVAAAAWGLRWAVAGHLPLFGTYESTLSLAVAVLGVAVAWQRWLPLRWPVAAAAALLAALLAAHGLGFDPTLYALTISERSWVVDLHAVLAWLAFSVLAVNAACALLRLLARRRGAEEGGTTALSRSLALSLSAGFLLHTAMIASGSFYKFLLFGRVWSFDPVESLGLLTWLAYGTLLHLHLMGGWEGRRLARWCLGLFLLLVLSYRGIVYFPAWSTYHIFDVDLRLHVIGREGGG